MSYSSVVLADSPVVFLQLDETTGTSAADSGSNATAWTYQTGVTLGATAVFPVGGMAIKPPGNVSAAILASVPTSLANPRGTSIEVSVYLPDTSQKGAFIRLGGGSDGWSVGVGSGSFDSAGNNLIILQEGRGWYDSGVAIGTGNHHIVATNDTSGALCFYIDGNLVKTITGASTPINATTGLYLAGGGSRLMAATTSIDNLALYATVLTQGQVTGHWNEISAALPPPARVLSQASLEVLTIPATVPRVLSQASLEVVTIPTVTPRALSSVVMEVLSGSTNPPRALSSVVMEVLTGPAAPPPRALSSVVMEVLTSARVPVLVSSAYVESLTVSASPPRVVSSAYVELLTVSASPPRVVSSAYVEVLTPAPLKTAFIGWGMPIAQ